MVPEWGASASGKLSCALLQPPKASWTKNKLGHAQAQVTCLGAFGIWLHLILVDAKLMTLSHQLGREQ